MPFVLAQVEATMVAEYHAAKDSGYDALDAFAAKIASFIFGLSKRNILSAGAKE